MSGDQGEEVPVEFQDSTQQPGPSGEAEEPTAAEAEDAAAEAWAAGHLGDDDRPGSDGALGGTRTRTPGGTGT